MQQAFSYRGGKYFTRTNKIICLASLHQFVVDREILGEILGEIFA